MEEKIEDKKVYEVGFHLLPIVPEESLALKVDKIKAFISENGGVLISEEKPEMRTLSYPISKSVNSQNKNFDKSYFGWVKFEIGSEGVEKVQSMLKNNEEVLRFIMVKTSRENTLYTKPKEQKRADGQKETPAEDNSPEAKKAREEDIDKSIEDLVIS